MNFMISKMQPFIVLALVFPVSCSVISPSNSQVQEFVRPKVTNSESTKYKLSRAAEIKHSVTRSKIKGGEYFFDSYTYNAEFEPMSQEQFHALMSTYGDWSVSKSSVKWKKNQKFKLTDFLPPIVQATHDLTFKQQDFQVTLPNLIQPELPAKPVNALLVSNCWGTVFELLRHAQQPLATLQVFYAPHDTMKTWFLSALKTIRPFSTQANEYSTSDQRNRGLKPGDVVMIGDKYIQHMAMFIDDDLYFEKAGVGPTALYRLTHWDVLAKTWDPTFYGYRYLRQKGTEIPVPLDVFGIQENFPKKSMASIPENLKKHLSAEIMLSDANNTPDNVAYALDHAVELQWDAATGKAFLPKTAFQELAIKDNIMRQILGTTAKQESIFPVP